MSLLNNLNVNIVPQDIVTTKTVSFVELIDIRIKLYENVQLNVLLKNSSGNLVDVKHLTLTGDDYKNWGNDDNYIISKVLEKLGFTKSS